MSVGVQGPPDLGGYARKKDSMKQTGQSPHWTMIRAWLPVIVWLGIIVFESTDLLSSRHTEGLLYSLATALFGHIDRAKFDVFHAILRKIGHFVGYGMLGLLVWRAERMTWLSRHADSPRAARSPDNEATSELEGGHSTALLSAPWQWATWAVVFTAIVASLDEWHQTLLPSRTGAFHDVILDTVGAVVAVLTARAFLGRAPRREMATNASSRDGRP
jgi:VanZ family protein